MHFHTATIVVSSLPLALGWPQKAVLPSAADAALLGGVAGTSFLGQLLLTRSFQLMPAAKAASINFSQVGGGRVCRGQSCKLRPTARRRA